MRVVALDLALTTTGVATDAGVSTLRPPKGRDRGVDRLIWIRIQLRVGQRKAHQ